MQYSTAKSAAVGSLRYLGYPDDLIVNDWSPRSLIPNEDDTFTVPTVAFWGRPFDQFRSAFSIIDRNGLPDYQLAQEVARKAWTHVAVCGDSDMSLWLFGADDIQLVADSIAADAAPDVFREHANSFNRTNVAHQKMRLRQYALFETDPSGQAIADWAIKPSAEQASTTLSRLVSSISSSGNDPLIARSDSPSRRDALVRWIFRVLALRIGIDRKWGISQGLTQVDIDPMVDRALSYPSLLEFGRGEATIQASKLTERILEALRFYDFSTIDPILVIRAFSAPSLKGLRAGLDLFPTPRPIAWDIISSIPFHQDQQICDATAGTGTFLIAAGLYLSTFAGPDEDVAQLLRTTLIGGDQSGLAVDLARLALDLVFGWRSQEWQIGNQPTEATLGELDRAKEWVLLGNLPWSASGRAENASSRILRTYLEALKHRPSGWLGTITPKSIWTKRDRFGDAIRSFIGTDFHLEEVWEMNWEAIKGGRSQALASVVSRNMGSKSVTVWKREDRRGAFQTIGYLTAEADTREKFRAPDAIYFAERLRQFNILASIFDVRIGLQPKKVAELSRFQDRGGGAVRFVRNLRNFKDSRDSENNTWLPESLVIDDEAVRQLFEWPQREYRSTYVKLPQLVLNQHIYEGLHRLEVNTVQEPTLFSNSFLICVPKSDHMSRTIASGIAIVLSSVFGRVWLYLNAWAGRDLSALALEQFPLPPHFEVIRLASAMALNSQPDLEREIQVCKAFGLDINETLVILGVGAMLGLGPPVPSRLIPVEASQEAIGAISEELAQLLQPGIDNLTPAQREQARRLWAASLHEDMKEKRLVLQSPSAWVSIEKSVISQKLDPQ